MYEYGHGVAQNYAESAKWYLLAATQGDSNAQFNMGAMYANGMGVEKSLVEASKMYKFAALQGDEGAQYNLGLMYAYGEGVEKNNITAFKWLSLAVNGSSEEFLLEALEAQDELAPQMNSELINQAEDLAILCLKTLYKQCD
jgi:TPR repeat protein